MCGMWKLVFVLLFLIGCGVKAPPSPPKDSKLPSLIQEHSSLLKKSVRPQKKQQDKS